MITASEQLAGLARSHGLRFDDAWQPAIERVLTLLARFNQRTNLVGDAEPQAVIREHLVESLVAVDVADKILGRPPETVCDVGAGAGLEALIMGLAWPDSRVQAVEPRRRRADFIELAADAAGIGQRVAVMRADLASLRLAPVDLATSRATFAPTTWLLAGSALVAPGGALLMHGDDGEVALPSSWVAHDWSAGPVAEVPERAGHRVRSWLRTTP